MKVSVPAAILPPSQARARRFSVAFLLLAVVLSLAIFVWKRSDVFPWIGSCNPAGYSDETFMAYCHSSRFGDFEHRAYWKQLEPVMQHVQAADVLFLGNSRTQYAFSTQPVLEWFEQHKIAHYVFGFGMGSQNTVPERMAEKYKLKPSALVINADPFFTDYVSITNQNAFEESPTRDWEYKAKMWLQARQKSSCADDASGLMAKLLCQGKDETLYRYRENGHWDVRFFRKNMHIPVKVDNNQNLGVTVDQAAQIATRFFENFGIDKECVILTVTPRAQTPLAFATELSERLGVSGIFPMPEDLITVDASHLDPDSADLWSSQFMQAAAAKLERCASAAN
ncbi:hypothetical protein Q4485_04675 [Granulosicoccaceae sp. 1_MG-2023]|nr:hypothetical protein [Granulosicoccaceae sp. 1_MG-2023]